MHPINLKTLVQEGEGYLVEFKESPSHLESEICAFANGSGGAIYIGITDRGEIKPTPLTNRFKAQIQSAARNCDPPVTVDVRAVDSTVAVLVLESQNKPVRAPTGFYLRIGATSQKLTRDEILAFAVRENRLLFDGQLYVEKTAPESLDIRQVELFRQRAHLDDALDNEQLLQNLGCLKFQNNRPYLTYAAVLLFAKNPQELFPHATTTLLFLEDPATIVEQKILRGTLFEQVEGAFSFLKSHLRTRSEIRTLRREEVAEIPEAVLRELLVNAVIHRDYFDRSADVVVKILPTHLEFANPGTVSQTIPLKSIYGRSYRRNPLIADLFYRARYIERAGTGLLRVKQALDHAGLPPLILSEEGPFFLATVSRPDLSEGAAGLNDRQRQLRTLPPDFFPISAQDYAGKFGISERMARLDIRGLVQKGFLVPLRDGRKIRYAITR